MGIGIRAEESSAGPGPPSHAPIAGRPCWERRAVPQFCSDLNAISEAPLVHQQPRLLPGPLSVES